MENSNRIPDKRYFRIGEVCEITGLKPHVLRYWETEFNALQPTKTQTNQRLYQRKDLELIFLIKELLYEKRFTIEGAKQKLKEIKRTKREEIKTKQLTMEFNEGSYKKVLEKTLKELKEISKLLADEKK